MTSTEFMRVKHSAPQLFQQCAEYWMSVVSEKMSGHEVPDDVWQRDINTALTEVIANARRLQELLCSKKQPEPPKPTLQGPMLTSRRICNVEYHSEGEKYDTNVYIEHKAGQFTIDLEFINGALCFPLTTLSTLIQSLQEFKSSLLGDEGPELRSLYDIVHEGK